MKQYPRCSHTLDFQFIVPPKDSEDKHYVPATRTNDSGSKQTKWTKTTIVATGKDIGDGINAPTIVDTKTAILGMGDVLDADVGIRKCPQFLLDKHFCNEVIRKNIYLCDSFDRRNCIHAHRIGEYSLDFYEGNEVPLQQ